MPSWMTISTAILIAMMSPQLNRFGGHYALGYTVIIPMIWFGIIHIFDSQFSWRSLMLWSLLFSLTAWIHAYYLLMVVLMTSSLAVVHLLQNLRNLRTHALKEALLLMGVGILSLALFQGIMLLTDNIPDRPGNPYGFLKYRSTWSSIFLPVRGPLYDAWHRFAKDFKTGDGEGIAYVGAVATLVGLSWLARLTATGWKKQWKKITHPALPSTLRISFWASMLVLLFAMAIPFVWLPEGFLDSLGALRQFRSLGRFAWIFYYQFTVLISYTLYQVYRSLSIHGSRPIAMWVLLVVAGIWTLEMSIHVKGNADLTRKLKGENVFLKSEPNFLAWLQEAGVNATDYQAILPIPVFNIGSEKFIPLMQDWGTTIESFHMASQLGLPLACGMMSRTSVQQSANLVQLFSSEFIQKEILTDFFDSRPLLILEQNGAELTDAERSLLSRCRLLHTQGRYSLRELQLADLATPPDTLIAQFDSIKASLSPIANSWFADTDTAWFFFDGFDQEGPSPFGEETSRCHQDSTELVLFSGPLPLKALTASVWIKAAPEVAGFPAFVIREFDQEGQKIKEEAHGIMFGMDVYRDWLRFDFAFTPSEGAARIQLCMQDRQPEAESLLIQQAGQNPVSYTHLAGDSQMTLPTTQQMCRSRWSPYH